MKPWPATEGAPWRLKGGAPDFGSRLNMAAVCVERHIGAGRGDALAFRFLGADGRASDFTYSAIADASNRFANILTALGVAPGETVITLLGRVPALYIAALGTLKARCVFSALFASFGPEPVRSRLHKGRARVLITTRVLFERKIAPAGRLPDSLAHVILVDAPGGANDFATLLAAADSRFEIPPTAAEDPALLHFTSGTTGAPKGAVHVHNAIIAHDATAAAALDLGPGDIYWCTADPGWVTGISYGLLAPLSRGATSIIDAGEFDPARWYAILADQRVQVWYTAPTAVRMLMKAGLDLARGHDLSALRLAASVGEPLNPEAVRWSREAFGLPIHDTWWQTETGAIMIANPPHEDVRPGLMGRPLPGVEASVVHRDRTGGLSFAEDGEEGELALRRGWPSMFRGYLDDEDAYRTCFVGEWYLTGDCVRREPDGWFRFVGRGDDVIQSAGHRIGPFEIESVLMEHPAVAEAAVIGRPDPLIGESVKAFVTVRTGVATDDALRRDLLAFVRRRLGPAIAPREIAFDPSLPKTRSGKILRRLLKARAGGLSESDLSALDDTGQDPAA